jgi:hypothetical protein
MQFFTLIDRIIVLFHERRLVTFDSAILRRMTRAVMRKATSGEKKQPA